MVIKNKLFVISDSADGKPRLQGSHFPCYGVFSFPRRETCRKCQRPNQDEIALGPFGKLYSYTAVRQHPPIESCSRVLALLPQEAKEDTSLIAEGIIPNEDVTILKKMGVTEVLAPGWILDKCGAYPKFNAHKEAALKHKLKQLFYNSKYMFRNKDFYRMRAIF